MVANGLEIGRGHTGDTRSGGARRVGARLLFAAGAPARGSSPRILGLFGGERKPVPATANYVVFMRRWKILIGNLIRPSGRL